MRKALFLILCFCALTACGRTPRYVTDDLSDVPCYDDQGRLTGKGPCAASAQTHPSGRVSGAQPATVISHYPASRTAVPSGSPQSSYYAGGANPRSSAKGISSGARFLNHESNLRCQTNPKSVGREFVSSIPFDEKAFVFKRRFAGDLLPLESVSDFNIYNKTVDDAFRDLMRPFDIRVVCVDGPFPNITANDVKGELSQITNSLAEVGDVYATYKENTRILEVSRKAEFIVYTPRSTEMLLAMLDGLRGLGIYDLTPDFSEYAVTFRADKNTERRVNRLLATFSTEPTMVAFDARLFRICDKELCNPWNEVITQFGVGNVISSTNGMVGSAFAAHGALNEKTLIKYLEDQDVFYQLIAEGTYIVPNGWQSRFDLGKCSLYQAPERSVSLLTEAVTRGSGADIRISVDNEIGEISTFALPSRFEDNIFIINIPLSAVAGDALQNEKGELFMILSPRLIQTVRQE